MHLRPVYSLTGKIRALSDPATGEELTSYASGAGDLGIVWQSYSTEKQSKICTGRKVTRDEAHMLLNAKQLTDYSWLEWSVHPTDTRLIRKDV
jgi:hypothetical protein